MSTKKKNLHWLVESAIMIAIATVLNDLLSFESPWAFGGSITIGSMVPLIIIAHRYGTGRGLVTSLVFSLIQMLLGMDNVMYGETFWQVVAIILLDYVVAYGVAGFGAIFDRVIKNRAVSVGVGAAFVVTLRFICHFLSGWIIWDAMWPNEQGLAGPVYSLIYNAGYMVPELIITTVIAVALYFPLKKYYFGEDLK